MGEDGRGAVMIDGKMQDDATYKQCKVVLELATRLAERDPELAKAYCAVTVLRSVLYMPSSNERALEKAKTIPADAIIFDLEDAVAPDAKEAARGAAVAAVQSGEYGGKTLTIRCNGLDTPWGADDLAAAAAAGAGCRRRTEGERRRAPGRRSWRSPATCRCGRWSRRRPRCSRSRRSAASRRCRLS